MLGSGADNGRGKETDDDNPWSDLYDGNEGKGGDDDEYDDDSTGQTGKQAKNPAADGVISGGGDDNVINVFTVASGHMYERLQKIMILSVLRHASARVKFWFISNYMSPHHKQVGGGGGGSERQRLEGTS